MFNQNPIYQQLQLEPNQYLADLDQVQRGLGSCTGIEADTGTGKSTLVIEVLPEKYKVIMAVPQRAQVEQLKSIYGHRKDVLFVHGELEVPYDLTKYRVIVTTYDGLNRLMPKLPLLHYILVIDEAHKLYQAAGYRSMAINKLVEHINSKHFRKVITLSAKLNPQLIPFSYNKIIQVKSQPVEKTLKLHLFSKGSRAREKMLEARPSQEGQLVMLRVNNKTEIEELATYYENHGLKVLKITSDLQKTKEVLQAFSEEQIPEGYDIVLTTSLTDEAININNTNIESVHILGGRVHSEEMVQFTGRFRKKVPPFHQYLSEDQLGVQPKVDLEEQRGFLNEAAQRFKSIYDMHQKTHARKISLKQVNAMGQDMYGIPLLRYANNENLQDGLAINETGINNRLYQLDLGNQYQNKNTLIAAYKRTIPGLKVKVKLDDKDPTQEYQNQMDGVKEQLEEDYQALIDECAEKIGYQEIEHEYEHPALIEDYCLTTEPHTPEGQVARDWLNLSRYCLQHQDHIKEALEKHQEKIIINYVQAARNNPFVLAMLLHLKNQLDDCVMQEPEAKKHLIEALRKLFKWRPELKDYLRKEDQRSGIWIKTNNHIEISDRLVRKIYAEYTDTQVRRSNSKYKFHFNGICPFGYRYKVDYLKYPVTPEGEKELIQNLKTSTSNNEWMVVNSHRPKRKKKK